MNPDKTIKSNASGRKAAAAREAITRPIVAATHTPGPWKADRWDIGTGEAKRPQIVVQSATDCVAYIQTLWVPDVRHAEEMANARLIAAAPEMLEALKLLATTYASIGHLIGTVGEATPAEVMACMGECTRAAEKAIAKATGGAL
jgi:hypothetical protein